MELSAELSEDSAAGRLILTKCSSILLKFKVATTESKKKKLKYKRYRNKKIYECLIEDTLKSAVYIRLSSRMVEENKLSPDMKLRAYIQFRLNRNSMTGPDLDFLFYHFLSKLKVCFWIYIPYSRWKIVYKCTMSTILFYVYFDRDALGPGQAEQRVYCVPGHSEVSQGPTCTGVYFV